MLFILLIPAALTSTFGRMVGIRRQGWALFAAMVVMLVGRRSARRYAAEQHGSQVLQQTGVELSRHGRRPPGGNLEGKEQRFGIADSALVGERSPPSPPTARSTAAHDSYTGIGGVVPLVNMMTGEVIFGGVGSGLYGMLLFVLLAVFIAGLMVGRTPEYLGKKIEAREIKLVLIGILVMPHRRARHAGRRDRDQVRRRPRSTTPGRRASRRPSTPTCSQANNNGSAFAGYRVQPNFSATLGGVGDAVRPLRPDPRGARRRRLAGRSGSPRPAPGTLRTDTPTFVVLLIGVIVLVAALTFFPALLLGPIARADGELVLMRRDLRLTRRRRG